MLPLLSNGLLSPAVYANNEELTKQYDTLLVMQYTKKDVKGHPQAQLPYYNLLSALGDIRGKTILDLACGDGYSSRLLAKKGAHVTGVDISFAQIERAKALEAGDPQGISYHLGDVAALDIGQRFDIITPTFLYHYAESKEVMAKWIERTAHHLAPGGMMVALLCSLQPIIPRLTNANHATKWEGPEGIEGSTIRLFLYDQEGQEACSFAYYYWAPETYVTLLQQAGFTDIKWQKFSMPQEMRKQFHNWQELEANNASALLLARGP